MYIYTRIYTHTYILYMISLSLTHYFFNLLTPYLLAPLSPYSLPPLDGPMKYPAFGKVCLYMIHFLPPYLLKSLSPLSPYPLPAYLFTLLTPYLLTCLPPYLLSLIPYFFNLLFRWTHEVSRIWKCVPSL
jgi:hypothetical protein